MNLVSLIFVQHTERENLVFLFIVRLTLRNRVQVKQEIILSRAFPVLVLVNDLSTRSPRKDILVTLPPPPPIKKLPSLHLRETKRY